jgi:hypothetical protein
MTAHVRGAGLGLLVRPFVQLESQASCAFFSVKNVLCYQEHE